MNPRRTAPLIALAAMLGVALLLAAQVPRLQINAETDAFVDDEVGDMAAYYESREDWGFDEYAVVCVTADDWFTPAGVERVEAIAEDLRGAAHVSQVLSVLDIPLADQRPRLSLKAPLRALGDEGVDLETARAELIDHELAVGNLISADGRSLNFLAYLSFEFTGDFTPDVVERRHEMVASIRGVAAGWDRVLDEPVRLSGIPFINVTLYGAVKHDLLVFGAASLALFAAAFALFFRRARWVALPMACCILPAACVLGAMVLLGIPIAIVTSNMPVLLFVLMLPYTVYFIERFRERRRLRPDEPAAASTRSALGAILLPCLFSAATTAAGFAALGFSEVIPIRDFGRLMAAGVVFGSAFVFLFLRTAMDAFPPRREAAAATRPGGGAPAARSRGLVRLFQELTLARPLLPVAAALLALAAAVTGVRRLDAETTIGSYFWPGSEVYEGLQFIDAQMGGTTWIEVILTSDEADHFRTEAGLDALATVERYFDTVPETGNILSLTKLRDQARKKVRTRLVPDKLLIGAITRAAPEIIAQTSDAEFRTGRSTVRMMETAPDLDRRRILDGLDAHLAANAAALQGLDIQVTGVFPLYADLLDTLMEGQRQTALWVPVAVLCMLVLLFRSLPLAVVVLLPQALPATVLLGVMGWAGIPLDLVTTMIASIAVGVGIDAAIQYTIRYRAELEACAGDRREALRRTHATVGRAIWIATSIIVAGFSILVLSDFFPSVWFGLFTALAMLISQLATLTVLPALFLLTGYPNHRKGTALTEA